MTQPATSVRECLCALRITCLFDSPPFRCGLFLLLSRYRSPPFHFPTYDLTAPFFDVRCGAVRSPRLPPFRDAPPSPALIVKPSSRGITWNFCLLRPPLMTFVFLVVGIALKAHAPVSTRNRHPPPGCSSHPPPCCCWGPPFLVCVKFTEK